MPPEENEALNYVEQRWAQLHEIEKESADTIFKYLLLINSGGAIATLSFLGASENALNIPLVKFALLFFIFGVLLIGTSYIHMFHYRSSLFTNFRKDIIALNKKSLSYSEVLNRDEERAKESFWHYLFPYSAFVSFIIGCILGGYALMCSGA